MTWKKLREYTEYNSNLKYIQDLFLPEIKNIQKNLYTPYDFFRLFIEDHVLEYISISINEYAIHKKNKYLKYVSKLQNEIEIQCEDFNEDEESLEEENYDNNSGIDDNVISENIESSHKWRNVNKKEIEIYLVL